MGTGPGRTVPLMRPLTPSSIGPSLHLIEHQLLEVEVQLENCASGVAASFEMMRCQPAAISDSRKSPQSIKNSSEREMRRLSTSKRDNDLRSTTSGSPSPQGCEIFEEGEEWEQLSSDNDVHHKSEDKARDSCEDLQPCSSSRPSTRGSR